MILQCDQCNTKFRLDDSKLKPGGVKVRCSKCRHVFLAGAEQKHEESEFDAILSGLGAPAPEKREEPAPVSEEPAAFGFEEPPAAAAEAPEPAASQPDLPDFAGFEFPAEAFASQEKPAPTAGEQPDFGDFDFAPEPAQQQAQATTDSRGLDYGEFAFDEEPPALKEGTGPAPAQGFDFGDFSLEDDSAAKVAEPAPAVDGGALDFGDFDFDAKAASKPQPPPSAVDALDFGELSFDEKPAVKREPAPPAAVDALDFGEFSFNEEPAVKREEAPAAAVDALDFGDLSFNEEPAVNREEVPAAAIDALDFGEFSFDEEPAVKREEAPIAAKDALDFGEFTFAEEPPLIKEEPAPVASDDFASFSFSDELPPKQGESAAPAADFSLDDFSLSHDLSAKPAEPATEPAGAAEAATSVGAAGLSAASGPAVRAEGEGQEPAVTPFSPAADRKKQPGQENVLDFAFGAHPAGTPGSDVFGDEELPPLSITSRRKGRSVLTVSIVAISVIVILALSGAGFYLLQSGPAAFEKFDKLGIGFVAKWFGMATPEEGRITVSNPVAAFHQNQEAGELFVVTGEAVNSYRKARASIHVKVSLFDKSGAVVLQKTAYCGNRLSNEQLATLPMAKIESIMNNQFGDSLSNLGVQPGQPIGFVVAIANIPKEAVDFGVEVVGSTVAGQ
ncbi:MAG: hypothetical protein A2075_19130 [Geobacteraceae bacterium GWC2_58_44]|nr:MAG: hypothetical protein A2075_19130 [Geobacteraceae bacterium GWC2_58_44]HBG05785.1 hypothetical protein [Geobacter sp.]